MQLFPVHVTWGTISALKIGPADPLSTFKASNPKISIFIAESETLNMIRFCFIFVPFFQLTIDFPSH